MKAVTKPEQEYLVVVDHLGNPIRRTFLASTLATARPSKGKRKPRNLVATVSAVVSVLLFFANLGLLYVTNKAADAAMRSADIAAKTLEITQRASLFVEDWRIENFNDEGELAIRYRMSNAGQSPAFISSIRFGLRTGTLPQIPGYQGESPKHSVSIAAGSWVDQPQTFPAVTANLLRDAKIRGDNWWFYIRIEYSDRFDSYAYCTVVRGSNDGTKLELFPAENYHCNE